MWFLGISSIAIYEKTICLQKVFIHEPIQFLHSLQKKSRQSIEKSIYTKPARIFPRDKPLNMVMTLPHKLRRPPPLVLTAVALLQTPCPASSPSFSLLSCLCPLAHIPTANMNSFCSSSRAFPLARSLLWTPHIHGEIRNIPSFLLPSPLHMYPRNVVDIMLDHHVFLITYFIYNESQWTYETVRSTGHLLVIALPLTNSVDLSRSLIACCLFFSQTPHHVFLITY